ncbi:PA14 domain-containing protein [Spirosoma pomorum]
MGSPIQSIAKVNSLSLQPGDQILFQRGNTFRGSVQLNRPGITVDAYGNGNKPILAGSVVVTNWTNLGNNVWQASCPTCSDQLMGLYRDNTPLPLGRYPNLDAANKGYLTVQSHSGRSQLTSQQSLPTNWTGGEAVFRPVQWILNRAKITGQSGNTLNLDGSGTYDVTNNWGYFIQNHPATLDQRGEWYYDPSSKTIRLFDNQSNPNEQLIAATAYAQGIAINNAPNTTIRNLQITQSASTGLLVTNSSNLVISGNDITQSGEDALVIQGNGSQVLIENNLIDNANNNGVTIGGYQNVTFRRNIVRNIGLFPGRGKSGDGNYVGFQSATTANTMIENNVISNIGYNALNFSSNTTVQRNQISNFCLTKSDGSGLYIWNGNQQGMGNIRLVANFVINGIGASEGSPSGSSSAANGIYLDDCTTNIEVSNNTVYNNAGLGIYLHGSSNIRLTDNTSFNNSEGQLAIMSANNCQPRNNSIQNNVFVTKQANQFTVKYESNQNDLGSYGDFSGNVYARPFEDSRTVWAVINRTSASHFSLSQWKSQYGKDANSTGSPVAYSSGNPDDYIKFAANPTGNAVQVALDGTYRDARNTVYTGQVTVPAYSSVVLLKDVGQPSATLRDPENPANVVAGLDYGYYEGNWTNLPNFSSLSATKTGTSNAPTLEVRNRDDYFALRYTGYISVPTDGVYTFYTSSDDGSKLLIGSTEVVNNDGGHAEQERSGTIGLKAGVHAISVLYFENSGGQTLTVSYSGPTVGRQVIPDASYRRVATVATPTPPSPTPSPSLRNPENPANAVAGLNYSYYEGSWGALPDFSGLSSVKTGTTNLPSLGIRNRDDNFGIAYTGYITVPTDGIYTFYTSSDDGSKLLIGSTEVVNNDGSHPEQERSGSIGLKAGVHAMTILYFQGGGGRTLSVSYSGADIPKQTIPESVYRRVVTDGTSMGTGTGLRGEYFNNRDLSSPALVSRTDATVSFDWGEGSPVPGTINVDNFSVRWSGQVEAPVTGNYTFTTVSDDGVRLWVNGNQVISNWTGHASTRDNSPSITLTAGKKYDIKLEYYEGPGGAVAQLQWTYPGQGQQVIPQNRLYPANGSGRLAAAEVSEFQTVQVYPVPARDEFWVRYYAQTAGEVSLQLVNPAGVPVLQQVHATVLGENLIRVPVSELSRGIYIVTLVQGQNRITRKVLLTE